MSDRDDTFGDPKRRLRDTIAPGTSGDPRDDMSDFPLIRDAAEKPRVNRTDVRLDDFYAYMPMHNYIYVPTREPWPAASVNARLAPMPVLNGKGEQKLDDKGRPAFIAASKWLDQNPSRVANDLGTRRAAYHRQSPDLTRRLDPSARRSLH
jgi:hypothetical protein